MPRIYADTAYFVALLVHDDDLHEAAVRVSRALTSRLFLTSDPVLVEVLAYVARGGANARAAAVHMVDEVRADRRYSITRQTPQLFDEALDLYRRRPDKGYSLTDCMSMVVCRRQRVSEVLTHDRHFEQEGFTVLL